MFINDFNNNFTISDCQFNNITALSFGGCLYYNDDNTNLTIITTTFNETFT